MKNIQTPTAIALSLCTVLAGSVGAAQAGSLADQSPFAMKQLSSGYMVAGDHMEGKCGEGKCGGSKTETEGKCGEGKCGGSKTETEAKDGKSEMEGKCGEGKCGGAKDKHSDARNHVYGGLRG